MLKFIIPQHLVKGIRVGIHAPWITHFLFADDCLVFAQATERGATRLQAILKAYIVRSGQLLNRSKLIIFFSSNCKRT
jgi:hypothetical protein